MLVHPPKPRLTLRVGITGHRPDKLNGDVVTRVGRQLVLVYRAIDAAALGILHAHATVYSNEIPAVRLVSGFAEGVDQMAVRDSPDRWTVEAILPFPMDEYLKDFAQSAAGGGSDVRSAFLGSLDRAAAVTQLPFPRSGNRDDGYAIAGGYLLRQIDVLIAVWDGKPPKPGGTGAIAIKAVEEGIPVVWVSTAEDRVPSLLRGVDATGAPVAPLTDCTDGPLASALAPIFAPPSPATGGQSRKSDRARLDRFLAEGWRTRSYFTPYDVLSRLVTGRVPRLVVSFPEFKSQSRNWDAFLEAAPEAHSLRERLKLVLLPRYIWADSLAVHFSHAYRSAYVLAYLLSALAVFIVLGEATTGAAHGSIAFQAGSVQWELAAVTCIILIVGTGRRSLWHERWLDYRALAESLRHGRFLAFLSEFGRIYRSPPGPGRRAPPWMLWYLRATMREIGLPMAVLDGTYQWRLLDATLAHEIREQIQYHEANRKYAGRLDNFLHFLGIGCFVAAFAMLVLFLIGYYQYELGEHTLVGGAQSASWLGGLLVNSGPWVTFAAAGLPALGAALAAIRVQGDFEGSKERSAYMVDALATIESDFARAENRDIGLDETAEMLISTARVMSEDIAAWQELYGRKRLTLPA